MFLWTLRHCRGVAVHAAVVGAPGPFSSCRLRIGGGLLALCGALAAAAYYLGANNKQGKAGTEPLRPVQSLA